MLKYFLYTTVLACVISVIIYNYDFVNILTNYINSNKSNKNLFTMEELKLYNGIHRKELYLALLGNIFDVTKGDKHYGAGKTYNIFVGRDASRNFINGKFNIEDVSDDIINLSGRDLLGLDHWVKFYKKEYKKVGKLVGRHYGEDGNLTPYGKEVRNLIKRAEKHKENDAGFKRKFPPCNAEYDVIKGSRVWCTNRSGGIERDWIGVPRQLYEPESKSYRCACISEENNDLGNIKEYESCPQDSPSCLIKDV